MLELFPLILMCTMIAGALVWAALIWRSAKRVKPEVELLPREIAQLEHGQCARVVGRVVMLESESTPSPSRRGPAVWIRRGEIVFASHWFIIEDASGGRVVVKPERAHYQGVPQLMDQTNWIGDEMSEETVVPGQLLGVTGVVERLVPSAEGTLYRSSGKEQLTFDSSRSPVIMVDVASAPVRRAGNAMIPKVQVVTLVLMALMMLLGGVLPMVLKLARGEHL